MWSAHQEKVAAAVEIEKAVETIATEDNFTKPPFWGFFYIFSLDFKPQICSTIMKNLQHLPYAFRSDIINELKRYRVIGIDITDDSPEKYVA